MRREKKYSGVIVPMITPFTSDLSIDERAVARILESFTRQDVIPFILGTTGEGASMSPELKQSLVKSVIRITGDKHTVYAGVSGNSYVHSLEEARIYAGWGIRAVVCHPPSYYPIEYDSMLRYFEELADHSPCPLILYNMPATTGISIPLEIIERLSYHPNIAGIKDSERDIERLDKSLQLWSEREDFSFFVGWAVKSVYGLQKGADGIVPSTGNFTPGLYRNLYRAVLKGNIEEAERLQSKTDFYSSLYQQDRKLDQSLPALKLILSVLGLCEPYVLPPLYRMESMEECEYLNEILPELEGLRAT